MKHIGVSTYKLLLFVLAATVFTFLFAAFPVRAFALEATAQTVQILPPGGTSCAPVAVSGFTPYVYEGALHSFEFTVADPSYVAVMGSVGNTSLPFRLMTRRVDAAGMLRIHVDIAPMPISGTLPLKVTLFSARSGGPVCAATVSMSAGSGPVAVQNNPVVPVVSTVPTAPTTVSTAPATPATTVTTAPEPNPSTPTTANPLTTSTTQGTIVGTMQNPLRNVCVSDTSAYRLWLILLVLYMLIVGAALWAEFPMSMAWARTPERIATIILVLLLLLLAFWYFSVSCRAALWMPLVAFLVAVLGLLAAFWNHPRVTQMLLIQETKPASTTTTIITPPAKK